MGWNDGKEYLLLKLSSEEGEIRIIKREDDRLHFTHKYYNKGMSGIFHDVSNLNADERHFITATWSVNQGKIVLYIDEEKVGESTISYRET